MLFFLTSIGIAKDWPLAQEDLKNSKVTGLYDNVTILQEQINTLTERLGRIETLHEVGDRFTDKGDGTIKDNDTGLIWLKKANCFEPMNWSDAKAAAASLAWPQCGLTDFSHTGDWRLPTKTEWEKFMSKVYENPALVNTVGDAHWSEGDAFTGLRKIEFTIFWSSSEETSGAAWIADVEFGDMAYSSHDIYPWGVWPVRGGIGPRFTDMGDGTIRDDHSGLIWLKDAKCLGTKNWYDAKAAAASLADGQCGLSDGSAARDWRLPTMDEWDAFMADGYYYYDPALVDRWGERQWSEGDAFNGVMSVYYWSNTKTPGTILRYFIADMKRGWITFSQPGGSAHVWPVRQ